MSLNCLKDQLTVGIIGTAGRGADAKRLDHRTWEFMIKTSKLIIGETKPVDLISGGAAWADHLAVHLYLHSPYVCGLKLELPSLFANGRFEGHSSTEQVEAARVSNYYHEQFSNRLGINSLAEIAKAIEIGAIVNHGNGFFDRNDRVAQEADILIAFTYGNGPRLKDGGTAYTARKYVRRGGRDLIHVDLSTGKTYDPGEVDP